MHWQKFIVCLAGVLMAMFLLSSPDITNAVGPVKDWPFKFYTYKVSCTYHRDCVNNVSGKGIDFTRQDGSGIIEGDVAYASARGTTVYSGGDPDDDSWGYNVLLQHSDNYWTRYAHLEYYFPATNARLAAGMPVGYMGNTGNSSAAHLHWHVYNQTTYPTGSEAGADPAPIEGVAAGTIANNQQIVHNTFEDTVIGCDTLYGCFVFTGTATCTAEMRSYYGYHWQGADVNALMHHYCPSSNGGSTKTGRWNPNVTREGYYRVYAFIPHHTDPYTQNAVYRVWDDGVLLFSKQVNQNTYDNDLVALSTSRWWLTPGTYIELSNASTGQNVRVGYDSIFLSPD